MSSRFVGRQNPNDNTNQIIRYIVDLHNYSRMKLEPEVKVGIHWTIISYHTSYSFVL